MLFVIPKHSVVDVITNSSSQIFVCDTKSSVEMIKQMLEDLIILYNKQNGKELLSYGEVFGEVYAVRSLKEAQDILDDYWGDKVGDYRDFNDNIILVHSADDNSIPWVIQEWITEVFCAERFHLG